MRAIRRLDVGLLVVMVSVVTVVGVEGGACMLRLLVLLSVCRRRWGRGVTSVRLLLLEIAALGVLVVVVVVHLMVILLVIAVLSWRHPSGAVHGLDAATATTTRDEYTRKEHNEEDSDGDGGDYPATPVVPVAVVATTIVVAPVCARDDIIGGRHCVFECSQTQRRLSN